MLAKKKINVTFINDHGSGTQLLNFNCTFEFVFDYVSIENSDGKQNTVYTRSSMKISRVAIRPACVRARVQHLRRLPYNTSV